ncbi:ornithine carbamoyltransferase [Roseateles sp.]|uniref:ornithine carbamoyltransferase n=1 Tax=Roseateles sp. TaxID=1971397 RepID=UPI0025EBBD47|nr:ornithine carbamoyltransferase [Roseateles sp.]MBV8033465.1 ornithine carbamoyltransferase [Roseateles sp.]
MCFADREGAAGADLSNPVEAAALLRQARVLARADAASPQLMAGKQLALLSPDCGDAGALEFIQAAQALGAHVSFVRAGLDEASSARQVDATARVLGRLYDAVECQHLPAELVRRIARGAGIPVFAGLATPGHPTATLVEALEVDATRQVKRRSILQAALLVSLG